MFSYIYQWLITPLSGALSHEISTAISWHGRLMVLAWAVLLPLGVVIARFFKIWPRQDFPNKLDHQGWWISHQILQYSGLILMLIGLIFVIKQRQINAEHTFYTVHQILGYVVVVIGIMQALSGLLRGSKGGPTDKKLRGDHFDMTKRRIIFEFIHKLLGYFVILLSCLAIYSGLVLADAPRWMFLIIIMWWLLLLGIFMWLQKQGRAIDTYQAIWGDVDNAANKISAIGLGIKKLTKQEFYLLRNTSKSSK